MPYMGTVRAVVSPASCNIAVYQYFHLLLNPSLVANIAVLCSGNGKTDECDQDIAEV